MTACVKMRKWAWPPGLVLPPVRAGEWVHEPPLERITTLEWCKRATAVIEERWSPTSPLVQFASPQPVSKYDLLRLAADVWGRQIEIRPTATPVPVDRTLVGDFECPPLAHQLAELREWYEARFGPVPIGPTQ